MSDTPNADDMRVKEYGRGKANLTAFKVVEFSPHHSIYMGENQPRQAIDLAQIPKNAVDGFRHAIEYRLSPVFMHGKQGRGKTMAAHYFSSRMYPIPGCQRVVWYHTLSDLQSEMIEDRRAVTQAWRTATCIVIDNFGATSKELSAFCSEKLIGLFDTRGSQMTIVCSNQEPADVAKNYDAPLVSRLFAGVVIPFSGDDRRIAHHKRRG